MEYINDEGNIQAAGSTMVVGMMSWQWVGPGETKFGLGSLIFIR
jgi:hypothetical protein